MTSIFDITKITSIDSYDNYIKIIRLIESDNNLDFINNKNIILNSNIFLYIVSKFKFDIIIKILDKYGDFGYISSTNSVQQELNNFHIFYTINKFSNIDNLFTYITKLENSSTKYKSHDHIHIFRCKSCMITLKRNLLTWCDLFASKNNSVFFGMYRYKQILYNEYTSVSESLKKNNIINGFDRFNTIEKCNPMSIKSNNISFSNNIFHNNELFNDLNNNIVLDINGKPIDKSIINDIYKINIDPKPISNPVPLVRCNAITNPIELESVNDKLIINPISLANNKITNAITIESSNNKLINTTNSSVKRSLDVLNNELSDKNISELLLSLDPKKRKLNNINTINKELNNIDSINKEPNIVIPKNNNINKEPKNNNINKEPKNNNINKEPNNVIPKNNNILDLTINTNIISS